MKSVINSKYFDFKLRLPLMLLLAMLVLVCATACTAQQVRPVDRHSSEMEGFAEFDDLHIVDCLLPGEVRRMGRSTFLSPRRPVRTTALACRIRGGEYTAYSRADYQSALNVWLTRARDGDIEAQHYVGEIYEKGMGRAPDLGQAFQWYKRAAEQGFAKSQVALGYFYEMGLGVEPDLAESLKWYRTAAGVEGDELVFAAAARKKFEAQQRELEAELEELQRERDALSQQVRRLRDELEAEQAVDAKARATIETLERMLAQTEQQAARTEGRLVRMRGQARPLIADIDKDENKDEDASDGTERIPGVSDVRQRFGNFYALIVGLEDYLFWDALRSPHEDARAIANTLSASYGFDTTLLLDASGAEILSAINDLRETVGPEDNVIIYFAGHGQLLGQQSRDLRRGYWLPINAELERTTWWVSNSAINDYLAIFDARSVLVIADSCFGGAMSTDPSTLMLGGETALSERLVELGLSRKSRFVLSSGGLRPVLDGTDKQHSLFARALIEVLRENNNLLRAQDLFRLISERTERLAAAMGSDQRPDLRPIREAGHEAGSFFLVPKS